MSDIAETYEEYKSGKYEMVKGMSRLGCYQGLDYLEEINETLDEEKHPNFRIDIERFEDNLVFMKSHIKSIEKENKQLKERYRIRSEAYNKVLLENASLKDKVDLHKEVIEEVRERIERNVSFCENDSQNAYEVCAVRIANDKKLLQILDKVKGE